jgi:MYXO-CTERM domain-containing protein
MSRSLCARAGNRLLAAVAACLLTVGLASPGCTDGPPPAAEDSPDPGIVGQLGAVSILDSPGPTSVAYFLRQAKGAGIAEGEELSLWFSTDPGLPAGTPLRIWGQRQGDRFRVDRFAAIEDGSTAQARSALIGAPAKSQTVAWVQMDVNGGGVNQTAAQANALIFANNPGPVFGTAAGNRSVVQYYDEVSYGTMKLSGQVEGPIPFNGTACNNFNPLAMDIVTKVSALGRTYDHYYLFWGSLQACGPGWGAQGTQTRPGKYVWLNNNGTFCTATGQEIGHNFGLMHASTMDCGTDIISNQTSSCTSNEYGNPMTVMGGGCRHLNAVEKWYSGYFGGCNAVRVRASGTFTLLPIETPCNGIQVLQIPFPAAAPARTTSTSQSNGNVTVGFYYLELRSSIGLDTGMRTGVYVHVAQDIPTATQNGPRTFLLDMNPANNAFDPMSAGQMFADPTGGVSFQVMSVDANQATIQVTIANSTGGNTCLDSSPLAGSGPASCGVAGGTGGSTGGGVDAGTGAGGATGMGGATGTGGRGVGGATGTGGATVVAGTGGRGVGGTTGTGGTVVVSGTGGTVVVAGTGGAKGGGVSGSVSGGCSCEVAASDAQRAPLGLALVVGVGLVAARRRAKARK